MLDINLIRENPKLVKKKISERGYSVDLDRLIEIDIKWKTKKRDADLLRGKRNKISLKINQAKKEKRVPSKEIEGAKDIVKTLTKLEGELLSIEKQRESIMHLIPNLQDDSVPVGGENKNKVLKKYGEIPKFSFPVRSHEDLLINLGLLDMERASKLSGAGFYLMIKDLAYLERALVNFMIDFHVKDGFVEVNVPYLVNKNAMFGTGNLPKFESDLYKTNEDNYLLPTAEVALTNIYSNEVLKEEDLPKKFVSFTQCFRTEAGKHGSETPGIFRVHQFEKVEMVYICRPEDSWNFLEEMTTRAEKILEKLKIPYRRVVLATEDSSFASAKTYDLEVYSPFMKRYLEASSCSNCTDFQARRMNTKYVDKKNERRFVHTLNGSGLATPRLLISLVENYQQRDGSIKIPHILQKYMNGIKKIGGKDGRRT